ncbi:MAG TPA: hypothetical protein DGZ24_03690 [Rhodospirillaceae bacterium]|nr:hypothetical protein [Rhodospirillaceae bacterium]
MLRAGLESVCFHSNHLSNVFRTDEIYELSALRAGGGILSRLCSFRL